MKTKRIDKRIRRSGKYLHELNTSIELERITIEMVDMLTKHSKGAQKFREEFYIIYNAGHLQSSGGYKNLHKKGPNKILLPRVRITKLDMEVKPQPSLYKESIAVNKYDGVGQFMGESKYITLAVLAHQIAHTVVDTPYLQIKKEFRVHQTGKAVVHGAQWRKLYRVLRDEYVNPYVDEVPYNRKEDIAARHLVMVDDTPFKIDRTMGRPHNMKLAKIKFGIKDDNKLVCCECGDEYIPQRCPHGFTHMNDDGRCMECHIEMNHGGSPLPDANNCQCGNETGYPEDDMTYFPSIPGNRFYR